MLKYENNRTSGSCSDIDTDEGLLWKFDHLLAKVFTVNRSSRYQVCQVSLKLVTAAGEPPVGVDIG